MTARTMMIVRDVMYTIMVVLLLIPANPLGLDLTVRIGLSVFAIAVRVWQHINYYKATGKIY